jgi:hypothetical protein
LVFSVLDWCLDVEVTLGVGGLIHVDVNVVVGGLVCGLGDDLVDVTSCATIDFILLWDVASVTGEVLLLVLYFCHFFQLQI